MCRIAGIIDFNDKESCDIEETILSMSESLAHGGPDDEGCYIERNIPLALAHRRLSIIDLSSQGHQPMSDREAMLWIIHNGEIYNFREIRKELEGKGHSFNSQSDTEVIIKAYEVWGENSFSKFIGMFAFCIFDRRNNLAYLVRDYAGMKPLYYSLNNDRLIFSSEVGTFYAIDPSWPDYHNWRILFLAFGHIPEPYTTLDGVKELPAGSYMKVDIGKRSGQILSYEQFYFLPVTKDQNEAINGVREILYASVERHLISDAPIGVFLSGGIDSSILAIIASQKTETPINTLSIYFDEDAFSERSFQKLLTAQIRTCHREFCVTGTQFEDQIPSIFNAMDQPTVDGINTFFISRYAHEAGLKTVLTGIGGDELFGGYPSFSLIDMVWFTRNLRSIKSLFSIFELMPNEKLKKAAYLALDSPLSYYLAFRSLFSPGTIAEILDADENEVIAEIQNVFLQKHHDAGKKNLISFLEFEYYMRDRLLKDCDFMSMWQPVELRMPFLDKELIQYVFSLQENIKFRNNRPKHLLINAFRDILPLEIVNRKKMGFTFPLQTWLHERKHILSDVLDSQKKYQRVLNGFLYGKSHWSRSWALLVMEKFVRKQHFPFSSIK